MQPPERRVTLVTGANRGIGFEIARQLAGKGLTVILGVLDEQKGVNAQKKLAEKGRDVHFTSLDVADDIITEHPGSQRLWTTPVEPGLRADYEKTSIRQYCIYGSSD